MDESKDKRSDLDLSNYELESNSDGCDIRSSQVHVTKTISTTTATTKKLIVINII